MKNIASLALGLVLLLVCALSPAFADDDVPFLVHVSSTDPLQLQKGFFFAEQQLRRNHPVTVYIDGKAVFVASSRNAGHFAREQKKLEEIVRSGATVIVCAFSMKSYNLTAGELLPGLKAETEGLLDPVLMHPNVKIMSW